MTNFLANLARRGAGLAASIAPRPASLARPVVSHDARPPSSLSDGIDLEANRAGPGSQNLAPRPAPDGSAPRSSRPAITAEAATIEHKAERVRPEADSRAEDAASRSRKPSMSVAPRASLVPRVAASRTDQRPVPSEPSARPMSRRFAPPPDPVALAPAARTLPHPAEAASMATDPPLRAPITRRQDTIIEPAPERSSAMAPRARDAGPIRLAPLQSTAAPEPAPARTGRDQRTAPTAQAEAPSVQVRIGKIEIPANQTATPPRRPKPTNSGFAELALARAHLNRNYR